MLLYNREFGANIECHAMIFNDAIDGVKGIDA
jgi:hypothetical protein